MKKYVQLIIGIIILIIISSFVFVTILAFKNSRDFKTIQALYESNKDSILFYKNKYGYEVAKTSVLQADNANLLLKVEFADANTRKLQGIIAKYEAENKNLTSALYIANQTLIKYNDSITNLISGWTADPISGDTCKQYPTYKRTFDYKDCFTTGTVELGLKTFNIDLVFTNEYEVAIGTERSGLFKRKYFAEITNLNKCTHSTAMKVYDKTEKKTNIIKPFGIGVVIGFIAKLLL